MKYILLILILNLTIGTFGQGIVIDSSSSNEISETKLIALIDTANIVGWNDTNEIGLETIFIDNLLFALKTKNNFSYPYKRLSDCHADLARRCVRLIYSNDSLVRIFNWLSPTTGTMHHFPAIMQAKNKKGDIVIRSSEDNNAVDGDIGGGVAYGNIYRIRNTNRQLYITIGRGQASGMLPYETIETFEVLPHRISDTCSIIQYNNTVNSTILIDRESSRYIKDSQEIPDIIYDSNNQIIIFPEIIESKRENEITRWTGKLIKLKFNGNMFVRIK